MAVEVPPPLPLTIDPSPPPAEREGLPEIGRPAAVACRFAPENFSHPKLRLSPSGPVFAGVQGTSASVFIPTATAASSAVLEMDGPVVLLRAHVGASELPLYLQAPAPVMGFAYPYPTTPLAWVGAKQGSAHVELDASRVLVWPERLVADMACDELGPTMSSFEVRDVITKKKVLPELTVGPGGADLSLEPAGRTVARVKPGSVAQILGSRRGQSRILIEGPRLALVGWVPSHALGKGYGAGHGLLQGSHRVIMRSWNPPRSCNRDLVLVAEIGETRVRVGVIKAGGHFESSDPPAQPDAPEPPPRRPRHEREWQAVRFPQLRWLALEEGARLLIDRAELSTCGAEEPGRTGHSGLD